MEMPYTDPFSSSESRFFFSHPGAPSWTSHVLVDHIAKSSPTPGTKHPSWMWDEFPSVGRDYSTTSEVDVYDETHADFRDVDQECQLTLSDWLELGDDEDAGNGDESDGLSLVDFGCGTGAMCTAAAGHQKISTIHAVDVSIPMLVAAKAKIDHTFEKETALPVRRDKVTFHHAGFLTYCHGIETGHHNQGINTTNEKKADLITSTYVMHHLPDLWKGVALRNVAKLLSDEGKLYLRDVVIPDEDPDDVHSSIENFCRRQGTLSDFLKEDAEDHFRSEFTTYNWILEGLLDRAGLVVERKEVDGVISTYLCRKRKRLDDTK